MFEVMMVIPTAPQKMGRNGEDLCSVMADFSPQVQPVSVRNQTAEDFIAGQGVPELLLQPAARARLRGGVQKLMGAGKPPPAPLSLQEPVRASEGIGILSVYTYVYTAF